MREEWKYKKLGEVCTIKAGYTPQKNELSDNGAYPYYKVADMNTLGNDVYLDITSSSKIDANNIFSKGAIVFPKNGAAVSTNKKRILKYDSIVDLNTGVAIFPKSINEKFAYYWFIDTDFKKYVRGGALPTLDIKSLKDKPFPSIDKSIQLAIVSELDNINELIRLKKEQLKDFDNLAQSIFYEMFGDPVENEKGWEVKKLGEVYKMKSGDSLSTKSFEEGDIPVYGGNGISGYHNKYNKDGSYIIIGRVGVYCGNVRIVKGRFWLTDNAFELLYDNSSQNEVFVCSLLTHLNLRQYANAAAQPVISNNTLKHVSIPLPPLPLQHLFAHRIDQIEHQKAEVQKAITDLETLLASRMQYWFE